MLAHCCAWPPSLCECKLSGSLQVLFHKSRGGRDKAFDLDFFGIWFSRFMTLTGQLVAHRSGQHLAKLDTPELFLLFG